MPLPDSIQSFLKSNHLTLVDVGARGGIYNFPHLAPWINVHAFEADPDEADDLRKINYRFASCIVHHYALCNTEGKRFFNLARQRSFSSFFEFNREEFLKHFGRMKDAQKWMHGFETEKSIEINCTQLDTTFTDQNPNPKFQTETILDFLKLDTQGTELEILQGAKKLLERNQISVIEVEVNKQPVYIGQPVFSVIDQYLRSIGFLLVDYRVNHHAFSSVNSKNILIENPRPSSGGDAVYVLDMNRLTEEKRHDRALKAALFLAHSGYLSIAEHLLKTFVGCDNKTIDEIFITLNEPSFNQKKKNFARRWLPAIVIDWLKKN
jgi:FkbM family methyltransferase